MIHGWVFWKSWALIKEACVLSCLLSYFSPIRLFVTPMSCSLPGSSVHGILQARILEWMPFPSPGDLHDPGIEPSSPALQADSLLTELWEMPYPLLNLWFWCVAQNKLSSQCTLGEGAGVQPQWIQGIRSRDSVGEGKTYLFINIRLDYEEIV